MTASSDPPFESRQQGISLDELAAAFAQAMGTAPRRRDEAGPPAEAAAASAVSTAEASEAVSAAGTTATAETVEDACPISPRSIFEAMLFVGNRDNQPLTPARAADLMRDVQPDEIPVLVSELNARYAAGGCPYQIVGEGDGYRLTLGPSFHPLRNRLYGRIREARLSQAAIDVLALVAYQQPITGEKLNQLRGKPSSHILAHLVRRGLLRIERPDPKRRTPNYHTTDRFLRLFNLQSLDELPQSEEPG